MRYGSAVAFRAALEDRLKRTAAERAGVSLSRLRKRTVFDRLLARLLATNADRWPVKGGVALDLRLGDRARATKDLDLGGYDGEQAATEHLVAAAEINLGDYCVFTIERSEALDVGDDHVVARFHVPARLDRRRFEVVTLDIGFGDPLPDAPDRLIGTDLLGFAGIEPIVVPALPLEHHLAEKLHAYTRTYGEGRSNARVKDLTDIVLICSTSVLRADHMRFAFDRTFSARTAHERPPALPPPPTNWALPYRLLAIDVDVDPDIANGYAVAASFFDPVLAADSGGLGRWNPSTGRWEIEP